MGVKPYGPGDEAEALLARADTAMYRNKRAKPRILHPWVRRTASLPHPAGAWASAARV